MTVKTVKDTPLASNKGPFFLKMKEKHQNETMVAINNMAEKSTSREFTPKGAPASLAS